MNFAPRLHALLARAPVHGPDAAREALAFPGLAFAYEAGETLADGAPRIVRVEASSPRGAVADVVLGAYAGMRDRWAFRRLVGDALARGRGDKALAERWARPGEDAATADLEAEVSTWMRERVAFRTLVVDSPEMRRQLAARATRTLALARVRPSPVWRGLASGAKAVRESGLWETHHVASGIALVEADLLVLKDGL
ncbi:MAG TPA: hypothetical protein VM889_12085 [Candidatus Thermoplasmatota archaeon]|nr:hypothetical protein [Candidatus Thermoplasmatota archaeon]